MTAVGDLETRLRNAWLGRISGCMLGKPVEILSMRDGHAALADYLASAGVDQLRDYVPLVPDTLVARLFPETCLGQISCAIPDDDINYTVLALMLIEQRGIDFTTADVARTWLTLLPGGMTFTAEREAYVRLLGDAGTGFTFGAPPAFDLSECSDNSFNDWIGAQIRADLYGWIAPGRPDLAADLAARDANLSHRGEGVYGAQFVAAAGACLAGGGEIDEAIEVALSTLPADSACASAVDLGRRVAVAGDGPAEIHRTYEGMSPVHTVNNLALVAWGLVRGADDFSTAIGDTVAAGWDTDCNGATVGALWGLTGRPIPEHWTGPWDGRVQTSLAGVGELQLDDLVRRTLVVCQI
ncbi:MAG: ADP-ribosylglycohydrolase family protein [Actinomycetia bacterium]|nr:ADP-ribosylglycohydrolase family protein [Actinomycetes bacterium]MCP4960766.1 ADP-ribosylglycohydrolase family protein [Actinomycetes bacterium]